MRNNIQRFQLIFLLTLYGITFLFFHVFPQATDASSNIHQPASDSMPIITSKPNNILPTGTHQSSD